MADGHGVTEITLVKLKILREEQVITPLAGREESEGEEELEPTGAGSRPVGRG